MPIYEYRCKNCGHEMEAIQKLSDVPLELCPVCEVDSLKKKISAAGFRLKGGGWYETDFKSGNKRNVSSADTASGDNTGGSSADNAGVNSEGKKQDTSGASTSSESSSTKKTDDKSSSKKSESKSASSD